MLHHVYDAQQQTFTSLKQHGFASQQLATLLDTIIDDGRFDIVDMDTAYQRLNHPETTQKPFVCFTFDDGYRNNIDIALPVFLERNLPFALFVISDFPDYKGFFWRVALETVLQQRPKTLHLQDKTWTVSGDLQQTFNIISDTILAQTATTKAAYIEDLCALAGNSSEYFVAQECASWEQLKIAQATGLVTIGGHTVSHPVLKELSTDQAWQEIMDGKNALEAALDCSVRYFAYPFGGVNHAAEREFSLAEKAGFLMALTTRTGAVWQQPASYYAIPRLNVTASFTYKHLCGYTGGWVPRLRKIA